MHLEKSSDARFSTFLIRKLCFNHTKKICDCKSGWYGCFNLPAIKFRFHNMCLYRLKTSPTFYMADLLSVLFLAPITMKIIIVLEWNVKAKSVVIYSDSQSLGNTDKYSRRATCIPSIAVVYWYSKAHSTEMFSTSLIVLL